MPNIAETDHSLDNSVILPFTLTLVLFLVITLAKINLWTVQKSESHPLNWLLLKRITWESEKMHGHN